MQSGRNNKFLTSDLDTLLRDAYGRFALLLVAFPFVWKRNSLFSANGRRIGTQTNQQELMETREFRSLSLSLSFFHVYLYIVVDLADSEGVRDSGAARVFPEEEGYFRFSGRSA